MAPRMGACNDPDCPVLARRRPRRAERLRSEISTARELSPAHDRRAERAAQISGPSSPPSGARPARRTARRACPTSARVRRDVPDPRRRHSSRRELVPAVLVGSNVRPGEPLHASLVRLAVSPHLPLETVQFACLGVCEHVKLKRAGGIGWRENHDEVEVQSRAQLEECLLDRDSVMAPCALDLYGERVATRRGAQQVAGWRVPDRDRGVIPAPRELGGHPERRGPTRVVRDGSRHTSRLDDLEVRRLRTAYAIRQCRACAP